MVRVGHARAPSVLLWGFEGISHLVVVVNSAAGTGVRRCLVLSLLSLVGCGPMCGVLFSIHCLRDPRTALAGAAQWTERRLVNQRVIGPIPSRGTGLGCGPGPQWGAREATTHGCFSPSFSLPSPLSKNKVNKVCKKTFLMLEFTAHPSTGVCNTSVYMI